MKVLFIMLIVVLLVLFTAPVFADKGGEPNDNAAFGQLHKLHGGKVITDALKDYAEGNDMNLGQTIKEAKDNLLTED